MISNSYNSKHKSTLSLQEQAYKKLKEAILFNHFRTGAIYSQENIRQDLGIGLTPLREALLELQNEGYVSYCRGRGVLIKPVSKEEAENILNARIWIEGLTASIAAKEASSEDIVSMKNWIIKLEEALPSQDPQYLYRLDHGFHKAVAQSTHNPFISTFCSNILDHYLRFEVKSVYSNSIDSHKVFNEHNDIFNAIESHNSNKAKNMMIKHLNKSFKRTLSQYWHNI